MLPEKDSGQIRAMLPLEKAVNFVEPENSFRYGSDLRLWNKLDPMQLEVLPPQVKARVEKRTKSPVSQAIEPMSLPL